MLKYIHKKEISTKKEKCRTKQKRQPYPPNTKQHTCHGHAVIEGYQQRLLTFFDSRLYFSTIRTFITLSNFTLFCVLSFAFTLMEGRKPSSPAVFCRSYYKRRLRKKGWVIQCYVNSNTDNRRSFCNRRSTCFFSYRIGYRRES